MADMDREIETLIALREQTRLAHEAAKDLRAEVRAAREARKEFFAAPELEERLTALTGEALERYKDNITEQIQRATEAVWNRFDTITMIALGEDPASVREGKKTVPDLIREFIAAKNLPYRLVKTRPEAPDGR
jgi:hypothetical protein